MLRIAWKMSAFLLLGFCVNCKSNNCNVLPDINIQQTFSQANAPEAFNSNGKAYIDGGVAGLIIYNMSSSGQYDFIAYDRCSPVNPQERNPVTINGFIAEDQVSGAQWLLKDGSPLKNAECPLRAYRVSKMGNSYTVVN